MKKFVKLFAFFAIILSVASCNTVKNAEQAKGSGNYRIYSDSYDKVWKTVLLEAQTLGLSIVDFNKEEGKILARKGVTLVSYGERVAIFVERKNDKVRVEIVSKRAFEGSIFAPKWDTKIFGRTDLVLR